ncbi:MAG: ribulose-phosphate 3-epimerase [Patescibacteria group bacterium]|nr:ribulose-phosphate 3-epimerase [Patescibacteria group bacterium]
MIVPAVLEKTFAEFTEQIERLKNFAPLIQIDVMDGFFVPDKSFEEVEKINELNTNVKLEVHLMVLRPLAELQRWKKVKNITRVIFHVESADDAQAVIDEIKNCGWTVGLAINPETSLASVEPYLKNVEEILFLTVHPGQQGAPFLPAVGEKIRRLSARPDHPTIGVDGGINEENISEIKSWGAEIFCVGSAITRAKNADMAYNNLLKQIK